PDEIIDRLKSRKFLDDGRFVEHYVAKHKTRGILGLREDLMARGIESGLADEILSKAGWPSLHEALAAKMNAWNLRAPLSSRDAARLFRTLTRLGYDEDAIREEIEKLHEQQ